MRSSQWHHCDDWTSAASFSSDIWELPAVTPGLRGGRREGLLVPPNPPPRSADTARGTEETSRHTPPCRGGASPRRGWCTASITDSTMTTRTSKLFSVFDSLDFAIITSWSIYYVLKMYLLSAVFVHSERCTSDGFLLVLIRFFDQIYSLSIFPFSLSLFKFIDFNRNFNCQS